MDGAAGERTGAGANNVPFGPGGHIMEKDLVGPYFFFFFFFFFFFRALSHWFFVSQERKFEACLSRFSTRNFACSFCWLFVLVLFENILS